MSYLDGLLPDGGVGVREAVDHVGEDLRVDSGLVQVLNKLLHLTGTGTGSRRHKAHFSPFIPRRREEKGGDNT